MFRCSFTLPDSSQVLLQPGGRSVQGGWWTSASPEPNDPPSSLIGWTLTASLDEVCEVKEVSTSISTQAYCTFAASA